jgi:hypothetical protein
VIRSKAVIDETRGGPLGATVRKLAALIVIDLAVLFAVLVTINGSNNKSPTSKSAALTVVKSVGGAAETPKPNPCGIVVRLLDQNPHLERADPFDELSPEYSLHFDERGSVTVSCATGPIGIVVGFNAANPSSQFLSVFGGLAHDAAGVDSYAAIDAALMCHQSALRHKGPKGGLFFGDHVDKPALHVDCRAGDSFTSFGLYHPRRPNGANADLLSLQPEIIRNSPEPHKHLQRHGCRREDQGMLAIEAADHERSATRAHSGRCG